MFHLLRTRRRRSPPGTFRNPVSTSCNFPFPCTRRRRRGVDTSRSPTGRKSRSRRTGIRRCRYYRTCHRRNSRSTSFPRRRLAPCSSSAFHTRNSPCCIPIAMGRSLGCCSNSDRRARTDRLKSYSEFPLRMWEVPVRHSLRRNSLRRCRMRCLRTRNSGIPAPARIAPVPNHRTLRSLRGHHSRMCRPRCTSSCCMFLPPRIAPAPNHRMPRSLRGRHSRRYWDTIRTGSSHRSFVPWDMTACLVPHTALRSRGFHLYRCCLRTDRRRGYTSARLDTAPTPVPRRTLQNQ